MSDTTGGNSNLTVANCAGSTAATDLGIAGTGSGASLTGSPIVCGSVSFYGSAGSDTMKGGTGSTNSLVETFDANMTLTGTVASSSLAVSGAVNKTDSLTNIANITLTDSGTALGTQRTLDADGFSGSVTLATSREDTLKGGLGGGNVFEINVSNMTAGTDKVTVNPGGGTNNSVVIEGAHDVDASSFGWITWAGAGSSVPPMSLTAATASSSIRTFTRMVRT